MDNGASSYLRYLEGDDEAFVELIRQFKDGLIFYLDSFTHDIHLAEDLTQETFIKIAVRKPAYVYKAQFKTWLYQIAHNLALDWLRRRPKHDAIQLEMIGDISDDEMSLEYKYLRKERRIMVRRALRRIRRDYSQVLYLAYFEGFDNPQIARIMKKSKRQIENLLYQAKKALKSELCKEALFDEKS